MRPARPEPPGRRCPRVPVPRPSWFGPILAATIALGAFLPGPSTAAVTWTRNLFVASAHVYQDPYYTACTAAATMTMLNTIAARGEGGPGFTWTPYKVQKNADPRDVRDMTSILAFERAHDTLRSTSAGSDAHGWRNALNYYGWGSTAMTDATRMVYVDRAYKSFTGAVNGAVKALARRRMPVGILAWAGGHAQVMTGYVATGQDPAVSDNFVVQAVYLSDPLRKDKLVSARVSIASLKSGALKYRFQWYRETDSPYDDPYTPGALRSSVSSKSGPSEWYHRWVIIAPWRKGITPPPPPPPPTPTPTPTPTPSPGAADAAASEPSSAEPVLAASPAAAALGLPDEEASAPPDSDPASSPDSTPAPAPDTTPAPDPVPVTPPPPTPIPDPTPTPAPEVTPEPTEKPTAPPPPSPETTAAPDPTPGPSQAP